MLFNLFRGTTGLNTKVDPVRLHYNPDTGVQELAVAYNVDIDDTGRISRRKGFTKKLSVPIHSLFSEKNFCLFVTGNSLCRLASDFVTYTSIATVTAGARMSFCHVNGEVYWMNGHEKGVIREDGNHAWTRPASVIGPETTRVFFDPPIGSIVAYYRGRIFVVQGSVAWYSEPFGFSLFDLARGFVHLEDAIIMFRAVEDGIFAGTEKGVFFLKGDDPNVFKVVQVTDERPVAGSDVSVHAKIMATDSGRAIVDIQSGDVSTLWLSSRGICFGGGDGSFHNLTEDKHEVLPFGLTGSGLCYDGKYIGLIDP